MGPTMKKTHGQTKEQLLAENAELRARLEEAEETLRAIREGEVDAIIVTGGLAYSKRMADELSRRLAWIAPVEIVPGENELESLAMGALRVLEKTEAALEY